LSEGDVLGNEITCPWHFWTFNIERGTCVGNPDFRVATHEVKVEGDRVLVRMA